ncbi:MAG: peptidase MA family metallohydrolase [Candidatus Omnitrophota bacterium]|nr:peptidase MA family metallohydrolase [Candidatus Omnitrophota bacterium]
MIQYTQYNMKMLKAIILTGIIFLFCYQADAGDEQWNIKKSKHFIIYYQQAPREYVGRVANSAEHYYKSITDYLGFRRFNFWTFDRRCKIYLYPEQKEYLEGSQGISWSSGSVHVIKKEINTYVREDEFFDHVLPHEMGHIIFREVIGFDKQLPLWIDEAVALLQEKDREKYLTAARGMVKDKSYLSFKELSGIKDYGSLRPFIFYSESASIIEFLLEEFGREKFVSFCRRLRDGQDWEQALLRAYRFESLEELEKAWVDGLKKRR